MKTRDDCIEGAWFCIVYVIGAWDIREDLEHRLVGVTDERVLTVYCLDLKGYKRREIDTLVEP
jgi:hypothetical protein